MRLPRPVHGPHQPAYTSTTWRTCGSAFTTFSSHSLCVLMSTMNFIDMVSGGQRCWPATPQKTANHKAVPNEEIHHGRRRYRPVSLTSHFLLPPIPHRTKADASTARLLCRWAGPLPMGGVRWGLGHPAFRSVRLIAGVAVHAFPSPPAPRRSVTSQPPMPMILRCHPSAVNSGS